jgi:hypothetical protein
MLGVKQPSGFVQYEKVRNAEDFGIVRQNLPVFVFGAVVDRDGYEVPVANSQNVGIFLHEPIQCAAPGAPIATNIEKNTFSSFLRLDDGSVNISSRASPGMICLRCATNSLRTCCRAWRIGCFSLLPEQKFRPETERYQNSERESHSL